MRYIQVETELKNTDVEPMTGLLLTMGISETVVEDPDDLKGIIEKKEGYEWDYIDSKVMETQYMNPKLTFYLGEEEMSRAKELASKIKEEFPRSKVTVSVEDDSQWKDKWKEFFKPAHITDTLIVKPTWENYQQAAGEKIVEIDPGMAFGTGTHETTSLCLKLMEKYMKKGDEVLDVGCGSGILSIGAALLEAGKIMAIDIDPEAVKVSKENSALNNCEHKIEVRCGNLVDGIDFKADIVVANLMADLVMLLSSHVMPHIKKDGIYISSGILVEKEEIVCEAIRAGGFDIIEIREDGMWCAIAAMPRREHE